MEIVGDVHNFGHKTTVIGEVVEKFRPIYWEWLFLSKNSPLRTYCQSELGSNDPFLSFASLNFHTQKDELDRFQKHTVETLQIKKVSDFKEKEAFKLGQSFGACTFFGITDLHSENFLIGRDKNDHFIASPIDIEICFEKVDALSETHLISSSTVSKNIVSIFDGIEVADDLVSTLIEGFLHSWRTLEKKANDIHHLLEIINLKNIPIRLVVTPTNSYKDYFLGKKKIDEFSQEEAIQLLRGDYPYFWTSLDSNSAFYFQTISEKVEIQDKKLRELLYNGKRFNLDNILKDTVQLKQISILQIARALDEGKPAFVSSSEQIHTVYFKDHIYVKTGNQGVKCKRLKNSFLYSPSESYPLAQFKRGSK